VQMDPCRLIPWNQPLPARWSIKSAMGRPDARPRRDHRRQLTCPAQQSRRRVSASSGAVFCVDQPASRALTGERSVGAAEPEKVQSNLRTSNRCCCSVELQTILTGKRWVALTRIHSFAGACQSGLQAVPSRRTTYNGNDEEERRRRRSLAVVG
jgi:hypothetical protein